MRTQAELTAVEGRKLVLKVQAWDEVELIGEADHEHSIVDETLFLGQLRAKSK